MNYLDICKAWNKNFIVCHIYYEVSQNSYLVDKSVYLQSISINYPFLFFQFNGRIELREKPRDLSTEKCLRANLPQVTFMWSVTAAKKDWLS